jgi:hypothetical protein
MRKKQRCNNGETQELGGAGGGEDSDSVKGKSRFRGVSWHKDSGRWKSQIWFDNKVNSLGYYEIEEDAAKAYDLFLIERCGIIKSN